MCLRMHTNTTARATYAAGAQLGCVASMVSPTEQVRCTSTEVCGTGSALADRLDASKAIPSFLDTIVSARLWLLSLVVEGITSFFPNVQPSMFAVARTALPGTTTAGRAASPAGVAIAFTTHPSRVLAAGCVPPLPPQLTTASACVGPKPASHCDPSPSSEDSSQPLERSWPPLWRTPGRLGYPGPNLLPHKAGLILARCTRASHRDRDRREIWSTSIRSPTRWTCSMWTILCPWRALTTLMMPPPMPKWHKSLHFRQYLTLVEQHFLAGAQVYPLYIEVVCSVLRYVSVVDNC
jgi:hypothetical protein